MKNKNVKLNYLLPNLFTASSIFVAVLSMINSASGNFEKAAWMIVLSLLFDGLDGKVARLTKGESKFGVEFDSLADIVAFGVAPALLIYFQIGKDYGKLGVLVSALYVVFGAVRLARFNVTTSKNDPNIFIGLPIPAAALTLISLSLLDLEYNLKILEPTILVLMLIVAILKVSNFRYLAFKKMPINKNISFKVLVALILFASLLYLATTQTLAAFFVVYMLSGPIRAIYALNRAKKFKRR
jgi:CDP-diacylglycerol--serine O-phosphatidyltransferase